MSDLQELRRRMGRQLDFALEKSWQGIETAIQMMQAINAGKPLPVRIGLTVDPASLAVKVAGVAVKPPVAFNFSGFPESRPADERQLMLPGIALEEDPKGPSSAWHPGELSEGDAEHPFWRSLLLAAIEAEKDVYFSFDDGGGEVERFAWNSGTWSTFKCPSAEEALKAAETTGGIVFRKKSFFNWHALSDDFAVWVAVEKNLYKRFTHRGYGDEGVTKEELARMAMEDDAVNGYGADYFPKD